MSHAFMGHTWGNFYITEVDVFMLSIGI